jgi:hypothetical protein
VRDAILTRRGDTIDGANIVIINLLAVVLFTIVDFWFLGIVAPGVSFALAIL